MKLASPAMLHAGTPFRFIVTCAQGRVTPQAYPKPLVVSCGPRSGSGVPSEKVAAIGLVASVRRSNGLAAVVFAGDQAAIGSKRSFTSTCSLRMSQKTWSTCSVAWAIFAPLVVGCTPRSARVVPNSGLLQLMWLPASFQPKTKWTGDGSAANFACTAAFG